MPNIKVYTDGSCDPKTRIGGWAFILIDENGNVRKRKNGKEVDTTNNRMELYAVIKAIKYFIKKYKETDFSLEIHTDSLLTMNCAMGKFKRNLNLDYWDIYNEITKSCKDSITFVKVKAHSGDVYNEEVDKLAKTGCLRN